MNLESPNINISKSSEEVFNFLTDTKNFKLLMPTNISKFELIDSDTFRFALNGMPEIVLRKKEVLPHQKIILGAAGGKLDFSLTGTITETSSQSCQVQLHFEGDFNPMMAMMIKKPISKFIETLAENIPNSI
jgi:carbon monoxide dehydrogenase subunit G